LLTPDSMFSFNNNLDDEEEKDAKKKKPPKNQNGDVVYGASGSFFE